MEKEYLREFQCIYQEFREYQYNSIALDGERIKKLIERMKYLLACHHLVKVVKKGCE